MNSKQSSRRGFLKGGAALAGLVVGGIRRASGQQAQEPELTYDVGVRARGGISRFENSLRTGSATEGLTPLQDSRGIITPSDLHFYVNHENGVRPDIDPRQHRLMIHGMVDRPLMLTMVELMRLPSITRIYFLECNANSNPESRVKDAKTVQESHGRTSCAEWTGVRLSLLLREAGVQPGANWLVAVSVDPSKHASSIPMEKAMDDALVAYYQNGESLRPEQGYPLRLILPGWGGRVHVKWLNRIKVVDQPYMTRQDRTSQMDHTPAGPGAFLLSSEKARRFRYEMFPKSVITFPSGGHRLSSRGFYEISGLAWSGSSAIRRVEVSTDGGRTWKDAELQEPVLPKAHTRFRLPWNWGGEEAVLQSRCTDENGDVQAAVDEVSKNWGADPSEACTSVMGEDCNRIPRRANRAYVMRWRVARDGSVHNAFVLGRNPEIAG